MSTSLTYDIDLSRCNQWLTTCEASTMFVLLDENTERHCWPKLLSACPVLKDAHLFVVDPGEDSKDLTICEGLWQSLLEHHADRSSLLINLGGGVVTDLGGFVAATFKRGIPFIHIPTTLLAQVDAAQGGKTGINFDGKKNIIGSFTLPEEIFIHAGFLDSLPQDQWMSGMAEFIKHALIYSPSLWNQLADLDQLTINELAPFIEEAALVKSEVVALDPLEKGMRKSLNFGHTTGHAIEALSHTLEKPLSHGEAVILGMRVALELSVTHCSFDKAKASAIQKRLALWYPHLDINAYNRDEMWELMLSDKKNLGSEVRFALIEKVGTSKVNVVTTKEEWLAALDSLSAS